MLRRSRMCSLPPGKQRRRNGRRMRGNAKGYQPNRTGWCRRIDDELCHAVVLIPPFAKNCLRTVSAQGWGGAGKAPQRRVRDSVSSDGAFAVAGGVIAADRAAATTTLCKQQEDNGENLPFK